VCASIEHITVKFRGSRNMEAAGAAGIAFFIAIKVL